MRTLSLGALTALLLVACTSTPAAPTAAPPSAAPPSEAPSASPPASAGAIQLQPAPANLGCDAVPAPYTSATFSIDPVDGVTANTDTGTTLDTYWSEGFVGGSEDDPVVRDPAGKVVVTDREVLLIPQGGAWPRLAGYFVCPSVDALYILLQDPA